MLDGTLLPYALGPHADELLSSWLGRLALHNSKGAWTTLVQKAGFSNSRNYFRTDIPRYHPQLRRLLAALGWSVEDAYAKLTTAPFFLAFCAHPTVRLADDVAVPELVHRVNMRPLSLHLRCGAHNKQDRALRFCPSCLSDDLAEVGEPYWHRQHQLPMPAYCARHLRPLLTRCPGCRQLPARTPHDRVPPPLLVCRCGVDLCAIRPEACVIPETILKLVALGVDSLKLPIPSWNGMDVRSALRRIARERFDQALDSVQDAMRKQLLAAGPQADDAHASPLRPGRFTATTLAATTVALGLNMSEAAELFEREFASSTNVVRAGPDELTFERLAGLQNEELRSQFFKNQLKPSTDYRVIALLQLRDLDWLRANWKPRSRSIDPPTTEEDRELIRRQLGRNGKYILRTLAAQARARAKIRDREWFDGELSNKRRIHSGLALAKIDLETVSQELLRLFDQIEAEEGRPRKIWMRDLMRATGRSEPTIDACIEKFPDVRQRLELLRGSLAIRRLRWAARRIILEGRCATASELLKLSSLVSPSEETREAARKVAREANEASGLLSGRNVAEVQAA